MLNRTSAFLTLFLVMPFHTACNLTTGSSSALGSANAPSSIPVFSAPINETVPALLWKNIALAIPVDTQLFKAQFKVSLSSPSADAVLGFSQTGVQDPDAAAAPMSSINYQKLATIVRFNEAGMVDVRNGAAYSALHSFPYGANTSYLVDMEVNISTHVYKVKMTTLGAASAVELANDFVFRLEQSSVKSLKFLSIYASSGSVELTGFVLSSTPAIVTPPTIPGSCGSIANGATTSRTSYQQNSVPSGQACVSEVQTATCNNGTLSAFSGTFTQSSCFVELPPSLEGSSCASGSASSISQFGFTWTFSARRPCGTYANGDYWVVGPVTISSISPESTTDANGWTRNGTMVNPAPGYLSNGQGFDSSVARFAWYDASLNVAPAKTHSPLLVAVNSSVVSTVSVDAPNTNTSETQLANGAVLTVVASAPAAGAFRPPMVGTDKTHRWNRASLNYGILRKLASVPSAPDLGAITDRFERPWFFIKEASSIQSMSPAANMPHYGRDQANLISQGMLSLHLNYSDAQKEKLFIRLVQIGIDIYGTVKAGQIWTDNGGMNNGRKAPMILAGLALNDLNILEWADASKHYVFQEDRQTWIVTQYDVGRVMTAADGRPHQTYRQEHVGMAEWGVAHTSWPQYDGSDWAPQYYRWIGGSFLGSLLSIKLINGGEAVWNYPPVFAYADRYWSLEGGRGQTNQSYGAPNNISPLVYEMWQAYR